MIDISKTKTLWPSVLTTVLATVLAGAVDVDPDFTPVPVFQYRVSTASGHRAWLWVPSARPELHGLLLCGMTDAEFSLVRHPDIRAACSRQSLGIVWFDGGLGSFHDGAANLPAEPDTDARQILEQGLTDLAAVSGYAEVAHAPWIVFGHSTSALMARNIVYWRPECSIALWYFKAGDLLRSPGVGWEATMPDGQSTVAARLSGVPVLGINGEYEEFGPDGAKPEDEDDPAPWTAAVDGLRTELHALRESDSPAAQLVDPGAGHHTLNQAVVTVLAAAIDAYVPLRVPAGAVAETGPIALVTVDLGSGVLSDSQVEAPEHATAEIGVYGGDPARA